MKATPKSNLVDYAKLYHLMLMALCFCFLYIGVNYFLPLSSAVSFFLMALGGFFWVCGILLQKRLLFLLSLSFTLTAILLCLLPLWL